MFKLKNMFTLSVNTHRKIMKNFGKIYLKYARWGELVTWYSRSLPNYLLLISFTWKYLLLTQFLHKPTHTYIHIKIYCMLELWKYILLTGGGRGYRWHPRYRHSLKAVFSSMTTTGIPCTNTIACCHHFQQNAIHVVLVQPPAEGSSAPCLDPRCQQPAHARGLRSSLRGRGSF